MLFSLIYKDLLLQKKVKVIAFSIVFYIIIFAFQNNPDAMLSSFVVALTYIFLQTACAYDDKNKTDIILNSLPVKRSSIVLARYISVFIYMAFSFSVYFVCNILIISLPLSIKFGHITPFGILGAIFFVLLINSIYLPIFYRFGYMKSRIINMLLFFLVYAFVGGTAYIAKIPSSQITLEDVSVIAAVLTVAVAIIYIISYLLSVRFYKMREF